MRRRPRIARLPPLPPWAGAGGLAIGAALGALACSPLATDTFYGAIVIAVVTPPSGASADGGVVRARLTGGPGWVGQVTIEASDPGPATVRLPMRNFAAGPFSSAVRVVAEAPPGSPWAPDTGLTRTLEFTAATSDSVTVRLEWR